MISLRLWGEKLRWQSITVHGDALAALFAAQRTSSKSPAMNFIPGEIGLCCERLSINITCKHVPESINVEADVLSRLHEGKPIPARFATVTRIAAPERDTSFYLQARA